MNGITINMVKTLLKTQGTSIQVISNNKRSITRITIKMIRIINSILGFYNRMTIICEKLIKSDPKKMFEKKNS